MYTERFSLSFVTGVLIAAAERRRRGFHAWTPQAEAQVRQAFEGELATIRKTFVELFDDRDYFDRLEKAVLGDAFARYVAEASEYTALERRDFGVWRGGDLVARGAFAVGGLAFGLFVVYAPFVPLPRAWEFLILVSSLGAPFIPDLQVALARRRYAKRLEAIVADMAEAQAAQRLYEPLVARDRVAGEPAPGEEGRGPARERV